MEESLVPPGNALRPRALVWALLGFCLLVVLMASDAHSTFGVPLGLLLTLLAALGLLDFTGCFDDAAMATLGRWNLAELRGPIAAVAVSALAWVLALRAAVAGVLPSHAALAPGLVTLSSAGVLIAGARLICQLASPQTRLREHLGFWLLLVGVGLYVPLAGSYSLLDPWETHYGEVAREMLARDDWFSFWWAQEGWFWSKPALNFWLQGLFFSLLGVRFRPGELLSEAARGHLPQPEWAARMPAVLAGLMAVFALYRFVSAAAGKRAGFLSGLVLLCAPYWSLLAHQSMTDMPYVGALTVALSLFGLGLLTDADEVAPSLELFACGRVVRISAFHGLFLLVLASVLPQLSYLVSRNVTLQVAGPPYGFRWHTDEFFSGSGLGNCGLPGNDPCHQAQAFNPLFQPLLGAALFGAALGYLLHLNRGERRTKRLYYVGAWYFVALASLAKGAPGFVLPLAVAAAVLFARRDWTELTRVELASLCLLISTVCLPWFVQTYMRHGSQFTDRLLAHDTYKRAFVHVHDTNTGTDVSLRYYIWQLGYGLFPWTGLAPLGLGIALANGDARDRRSRDLSLLVVLWLILAFGLFTLSLTKFHHYALPCTPPLAIASALLLERALGHGPFPHGARRPLYLLCAGLAAALLIYGGSRLNVGGIAGPSVESSAIPERPVWIGCLLCAGAVVGWLLLAPGLTRQSLPTESTPGFHVLAISAALLSLLVARDLSTSVAGDVPASARLLHLITYNYQRRWPASLDFEAIQWGFGVAAAVCLACSSSVRFRPHAAPLLCAVGLWFCAFTLWIYLPKVAPHFGQRELLLAYYRTRQSADEPIVAYQMNWKGENFYTGNRLPAFVSTGAQFKTWLTAQRKAGTKVIYFLTEHGRLGTLKSELGPGFRSTPVTGQHLNDKFALVRTDLLNAAQEPGPE